MYSAGYTPKGKGLAAKLFLLGITATLISLVLSLYLSYAFNMEYRVQGEFELQEDLSRTYTLDISEGDVVLANYSISITGVGEMNVSVDLLNANGFTLHSRTISIDRTVNLTEQVSIDGSLDHLAITITNEGWDSAKGHVDLTYTRSPTVYSLASLASAFIGIGGVVLTSFSVLLHLVSRMDQRVSE